MIRAAERNDAPPALRRLASLATLDNAATDALLFQIARASPLRGRRDIMAEGARISGPRLIVSGWVARARVFPDGRRQLLSFLLPGELIGLCGHPSPLAVSTLTAMTDVTLCPAPPADENPSLARAYAVSQAIDEAHLLDHITRLGRLNAQERIYSLLLELNQRLSLGGLAHALADHVQQARVAFIGRVCLDVDIVAQRSVRPIDELDDAKALVHRFKQRAIVFRISREARHSPPRTFRLTIALRAHITRNNS